MKISTTLLYLVLCFFTLFSCQKEQQSATPQSEAITEPELKDFTVIVDIDPGLNKDLPIKIYSFETDSSVSRSTNSDTLIFQGKTDHLQQLDLRVDVTTDKFFVYDDTVTIKIIPGGFNGYTISKTASKYKDSIFKYYEEYLLFCGGEENIGLLFKHGDSLYMDSLARHVLPQIRKVTKEAYDSLLTRNAPDILLADLLSGQFESYYVSFNKYDSIDHDDYSFFEERIATFEALDYPIKTIEDLRNNINRFNKQAYQPRVLLDKSLPDIDGNYVSLKSVAAKNKYVLLTLWIRNCRPCRAFNKDLHKVYDQLREAGLEVININADRYESDSRPLVDQDNMKGFNLYTNAESPLKLYYNQKGSFPVKKLFSSDGKEIVLDEKIKTPEHLLEIVRGLNK